MAGTFSHSFSTISHYIQRDWIQVVAGRGIAEKVEKRDLERQFTHVEEINRAATEVTFEKYQPHDYESKVMAEYPKLPSIRPKRPIYFVRDETKYGSLPAKEAPAAQPALTTDSPEEPLSQRSSLVSLASTNTTLSTLGFCSSTCDDCLHDGIAVPRGVSAEPIDDVARRNLARDVAIWGRSARVKAPDIGPMTSRGNYRRGALATFEWQYERARHLTDNMPFFMLWRLGRTKNPNAKPGDDDEWVGYFSLVDEQVWYTVLAYRKSIELDTPRPMAPGENCIKSVMVGFYKCPEEDRLRAIASCSNTSLVEIARKWVS